MFIQITKDKFIRRRDIIGVFDLDTSTVSGITKNFLSRAEKENKIINKDINILPKSFVLTIDKKNKKNKKNKNHMIYFSPNTAGHICK